MKKPNMPSMPAVPKFDFRALAEDFKSLDPKDIGTWPLLPRVTVLLGVFAALLVAGWWFDWKSQLEELEGKQQQEAKLKDEYLDKKRQAVNLEEHRKQLAEIDKSFGALLKQLPNKAEMEALLIDINQAGLGRGLQFELFKPGKETTKDFYAELPITLKITGIYHDLGAFSADVAKLSRIVSLTNVAVVPDKGGQLKMDAIAMTYRYLDEEELAAQRRAKAAQAKAKGAKK
ncbi:MAG: type 4a pilus biogenesis protein PilO [Rhodocyclales bacterium]|jgi:type IV pilus assembly protein PilO|nr:type 4a pilus biogenesis protein PilO [Rhodocyclales bacterium]